MDNVTCQCHFPALYHHLEEGLEEAQGPGDLPELCHENCCLPRSAMRIYNTYKIKQHLLEIGAFLSTLACHLLVAHTATMLFLVFAHSLSSICFHCNQSPWNYALWITGEKKPKARQGLVRVLCHHWPSALHRQSQFLVLVNSDFQGLFSITGEVCKHYLPLIECFVFVSVLMVCLYFRC